MWLFITWCVAVKSLRGKCVCRVERRNTAGRVLFSTLARGGQLLHTCLPSHPAGPTLLAWHPKEPSTIQGIRSAQLRGSPCDSPSLSRRPRPRKEHHCLQLTSNIHRWCWSLFKAFIFIEWGCLLLVFGTLHLLIPSGLAREPLPEQGSTSKPASRCAREIETLLLQMPLHKWKLIQLNREQCYAGSRQAGRWA